MMKSTSAHIANSSSNRSSVALVSSGLTVRRPAEAAGWVINHSQALVSAG